MSRATEVADRVLELVAGRAEAEVRVALGPRALTRFANSFIHQNVSEEAAAVSLRVAVEGRVASAATTRLDDAGLRRVVDDALEAARLRPVDDEWPGVAPPVAAPEVDHHDSETAAATPRDRAERVRAFVDAGGAGSLAAGYCATEAVEVGFANTAGQRLAGKSTSAVLDGIHRVDGAAGSGHVASFRIADVDGAAVGEIAAGRAMRGRGPVDLPPGEYEVVLAPECVATIVVFLGYYGFNAKAHQEGMSFVTIGERRFDPAFRLVDDPLEPRALGLGFDAEGTPRRRLELVADGVTVALVHDRRTAARTGAVSTGHHHPGSDVAGPFPTDLFVTPGDRGVDDLLSSVERGLYVATFNYCRVLEPKTLAVTGLTRNGTFLVENGRVTRPVANLRFTQSFVDALGEGRVWGVGDDARFADSEFGPAMAFVPSLHLSRWRFTGGAEG